MKLSILMANTQHQGHPTPRLPGGFSLPPFGIHQILALMIVCIALWSLSLLWLGMQGADQWIGAWQQDIRFHLYLAPKEKSVSNTLINKIKALKSVSSVRIVSKEETRQWLHHWLGDTGMDENDLMSGLPRTLEISPQPHMGELLFDDLRDIARHHNAHVNENESYLVNAQHWMHDIRRLIWFVTALLAMAMAIIISNTLRMTILARADEVHLMRLLGAQEWFVRMPFILEGVLLGGGAGLLAWLMTWPLIFGASNWLDALHIHISGFPLFFPLLNCGMLSGFFGAFVATWRLDSSDEAA